MPLKIIKKHNLKHLYKVWIYKLLNNIIFEYSINIQLLKKINTFFYK